MQNAHQPEASLRAVDRLREDSAVLFEPFSDRTPLGSAPREGAVEERCAPPGPNLADERAR